MTTESKKDKLVRLNDMADGLSKDTPEHLALMEGLSDQQRTIVKFKMRGATQKAIAQYLSVSPARVSQEMKAIREYNISKGSDINQAALVGESVTLFEEIEKKGWEVFEGDDNKKLRALETIMAARNQQLKLLMDLGLLQRAAVEHKHGIVESPLMDSLTAARRHEIVARIIEPGPGLAPTPPEEIEDAEFTEAEFEAEGPTID